MPLTMRSERGLTIIEVIVAAVLLAAASGAIAAMVIGSSTSQLGAKIRNRQNAAAESVYANLRADRSWLDASGTCATRFRLGATCDLTPLTDGDPALEATDLDITFEVTATARGFDSPVDGTGGDDADDLRPDAFRLTVQVRGPRGTSASNPMVVSGTIPARASPSAGVIEVQVCAVAPQADERLVIGTCDRRRDTTLDAPFGPPDVSSAEWQAYSTAPDFARTISIMPVEGLSVSIAPQRGRGTRLSARTDAQGRAIFSGVDPGEYEVVADDASAYEPWPSHSRPVDGVVDVSPGDSDQALLALRPASRHRVVVTAAPGDPDRRLRWEVSAGSAENMLRLIAAPLGRQPDVLAAASYDLSGGGSRRRGPAPTQQFVFDDVPPGLYLAYVGTSDDGIVLPLLNDPRYIWVNPDGRIAPPAPVADEFTAGFCTLPTWMLTEGDASDLTNYVTYALGAEIGPCDLGGISRGSGGS